MPEARCSISIARRCGALQRCKNRTPTSTRSCATRTPWRLDRHFFLRLRIPVSGVRLCLSQPPSGGEGLEDEQQN